MPIADYVANTQLRRKIENIIDKSIAGKPVTGKDLEDLIKLLSRMAIYINRKTTHEQVRAFGGGLAISFKRAGELNKIFEEETMIPINNIKKLASDLLKKTEEEIRNDYGGLGDIKANIKESLNQLAASIRMEEIPKIIAAKSKAA